MERKVYEFISKQTGDPIIEWRVCPVTNESFAIFQSDVDFLDKIAPVIHGKKCAIPLPTLSPEARSQRRMATRNRKNLYRRKCDLSGKNLISMYSPDKPYKIYNNLDREMMDATTYGRDYDFTRPFFEQLNELIHAVPRFHSAVVTDTMFNAEYVNGAHGVKDSYLSYSVTDSENIYYSEMVHFGNVCMDCLFTDNSENSYECIDGKKLHSCFRCNNCYHSSRCYFCDTCENCQDCFACAGLVNCQYYIYNKKHSKQEYLDFIKKQKFTGSTIPSYLATLEKVVMTTVRAAVRTNNVEKCTGNNLKDSKDCFLCSECNEVEDSRYCEYINYSHDCGDVLYFGSEMRRSYECCGSGMNAEQLYFCSECYDNVNNIFYGNNCRNTTNAFGCVGTNNKSYCILNKQYTQAEYEAMIPKIIAHMTTTGERGEFPPISTSCFGYNESFAQEHFPLTEKEAKARGYKWMEYDIPINLPENAETIPASEVPEDITQTKDDIINKIILCEKTKKPYRFIAEELRLCRRRGIPLSREHPDVRHKRRLAQKTPNSLHLRTCDTCGLETLSVYKQTCECTVYCEACYNKAVYG